MCIREEWSPRHKHNYSRWTDSKSRSRAKSGNKSVWRMDGWLEDLIAAEGQLDLNFSSHSTSCHNIVVNGVDKSVWHQAFAQICTQQLVFCKSTHMMMALYNDHLPAIYVRMLIEAIVIISFYCTICSTIFFFSVSVSLWFWKSCCWVDTGGGRGDEGWVYAVFRRSSRELLARWQETKQLIIKHIVVVLKAR